MKVVTVAGPPACGKTSVIVHLARALRAQGSSVAVVKFDCLSTADREIYEAEGIPVITGLSANMCPDHYYVSNILKGVAWARARGADVVVSESAGLCNRCSPHIKGVPAVCVVDCLSGSRTPAKVGPMLRLADAVVVTKGDIVSQAEREVFAREAKLANPNARVMLLNGITGQGTFMLRAFVEQASDLPESLFADAESGGDGGAGVQSGGGARPDGADELRLRFTMPSALCSYCMGQTRVGTDFQMGAVREMDVSR